MLLSLDDAAQVGRVVLKRGNGNDTEAPAARDWTVGNHIGIWLGVVCAVLIAAAPLVTHHTPQSLTTTLLAEMHPWPGD